MRQDPINRLDPHPADALLQPGDVAPLLVLLRDPAPLVSSVALRALVRLPVSREVWFELSRHVLDLLSALPRDRTVDTVEQRAARCRALNAAFYVPTKSVRSALLDQLIDDVANPFSFIRAQAAAALASLGIAPRQESVRSRFDATADDTVRFWLALALARLGELEPAGTVLTDLKNGTAQPRFFWGDYGGPALFVEQWLNPVDTLLAYMREPARDNPSGVTPDLGAAPVQVRDTSQWHTRPETEEIPGGTRQEAAAIAAAYMERSPFDEAGTLPWDDEAKLRYLEPELATRLISALFSYLASETEYEHYSGPRTTAGNWIVRLAAQILRWVVPDILTLFDSYRRLSAIDRSIVLAERYRTLAYPHDRYLADSSLVWYIPADFDGYATLPSTDQALRWQIAWVVSRADPRQIIRALAPRLSSVDDGERLAAAQLIEDAILYMQDDSPPTFGGGRAPGDVAPRAEVLVDDLDYAVGNGHPLPMEPLQPVTRNGGEERAPDEAAPAEVRDPPRAAYALLDCPHAVVAGQEFGLEVGLAATPTPGVTAGPLRRPPASVGPYVLTILIVADGLPLREGESWRRELPVTAEEPYPTFILHLTAAPQEENIRAYPIQAFYSVDGQQMGWASRAVAVVRSRELLDKAPAAEEPTTVDIPVPSSDPAPDFTIRISTESPGYLLWTFDTPFKDIELPDEAIRVYIGGDAKDFARDLVVGVDALEGQMGLYVKLVGVARTIADKMPLEFWNLLGAVAARVQRRRTTILFLSEEPHVPWELAFVDEPIDLQAPPFLAAQANVGRWVLGRRKRPRLPPPAAVQVGAIAVVSGRYGQHPGWQPLEEAEREATDLQNAYGAQPVDATAPDVLRCIKGTPQAQLLHFALHGVYDPGSQENGLILVDGTALDPDQVKGVDLTSAPFVFLNACQVGSGNAVLGDYAGMAAAFLYAGASGVVAPLWSIKDTVAREVALRFYKQVFAGGTVADALRIERGRFGSAQPASATFLAYQFFGHPNLRIQHAEMPAGGSP